MDTAKLHWTILQGLGTDLANRVRKFMVIGPNGEGLMVATEDGQGFWFGTIQFGTGKSRTSIEPTSLNVPGHLVSMAQSENYIILLNKRGEIYSMGQNNLGQLGLGTKNEETHFSPQLIPIPHKFISVRCGNGHSLALTEDGKVWCWGANEYCQVDGQRSTITVPHQISVLDPNRVVSIECGSFHSLALTDRGEVYAWGSNGFGQLGDGSKTYTLPPTRIPIPSPVQSMAAGESHTLLLTQTGEVWACGGNRCGQLGLPKKSYANNQFSRTLVKVGGLPPVSQIASHYATELSIAMSSDQRCFVWGQLSDETSIYTPLKLPLFYSTVESPQSFSTPHSVSIPETLPSRLTIQLSRMFDNPETSPDVQFVVEQRTIHAHRIILSNSSDYFARMFSERWTGPVDPEDPIVRVTISDHSYQVFHALLRFLYTDYLEVSHDLLLELFELASLYLVSNLQQLCISRMRTTLTPTTCCLYYPLTHRHSLLPELATFQQELVQFASTRMSEVVNSAFYQSMESDIRDQLNQNFLDISVNVNSP